MGLGTGVDSISEEPRGKAVKISSEYQFPIKDSTLGTLRQSNSKVCLTQTEFEKQLDVGASVAVRLGLVGKVNFKLDYANNNSISKSSVCIVVKSSVIRQPRLIADVVLLDEAKNLYNQNPIYFLKQYGDSYVAGLETGGTFYGIISVECDDDEEKRTVSAGLGASFNMHFLKLEAEGKFKTEFLKIADKYHCNIEAFYAGANVKSPNNIDDLFGLKSEFEEKMKDQTHDYVLSANLMDYVTLGLPEGGSALTRIQYDRNIKITKSAELISEIKSSIELIDNVIESPHLYKTHNLKNLTKRKNELNALGEDIKSAISQLLVQPDYTFDISKLKLPKLKLPQKIDAPQPKPQISSSISDKYSVVQRKGLLGLPIGSEQECGDGIGRFQEYEHGRIYFHRRIGTIEIHEPNYRLYKELGLEKGKLGYPISDEQKDPFGRICNTFQGGKICHHVYNPEPKLMRGEYRNYPVFQIQEVPKPGSITIADKVFAESKNITTDSEMD
jgi:hypothetical protein